MKPVFYASESQGTYKHERIDGLTNTLKWDSYAQLYGKWKHITIVGLRAFKQQSCHLFCARWSSLTDCHSQSNTITILQKSSVCSQRNCQSFYVTTKSRSYFILAWCVSATESCPNSSCYKRSILSLRLSTNVWIQRFQPAVSRTN